MADSNGESSTPPDRERQQLTALQRKLIAGVALGAAVIALIGFVGSYAAVRALAERKHFGFFAMAFPIGIDAGVLVLLALDLLLTWLRMPLPMLRHVAWLLTLATMAFNGAAAWPDPLGVGMHAVIPILFVVVIEAARHAIGTAADITAERHMERVRLARWLLDPIRTFFLWRSMKLWELRSYDQVIAIEQDRMIEQARLRARYGRRWRSKAPVSAVMALRLTRYGRPLAPVEGVLDIDPAPSGALPAAPRGASELPPSPLPVPDPSTPKRPAPDDQGAPEESAANPEGAPKRPADEDPGAPEAPRTPAPKPPKPETPANGEAPRDEPRAPSRAEAKRRIRALYDELDARPGEGVIVKLLERLDGYPYKSRRHAQTLRDEIEHDEPKLTERGSDNVRAMAGR